MQDTYRFLKYPANPQTPTTEIIGDYLDNGYDGLILTRAASLYIQEFSVHSIEVDYLIQCVSTDRLFTGVGITMTSIKRNAMGRHGPKTLTGFLKEIIIPAIRENKGAFEEKEFVFLPKGIPVHAQRPEDRDWGVPPGEYNLLALTAVRSSDSFWNSFIK